MIETIKKIIAPLQRRIMMMILRGVIQSVKSDTGLQLVQLTALPGEVIDNLEYVEPYGFTSIPVAGAEAVVLFIGGNRDHGIILSAGDRRYRPKTLSPGDSAMYHSDGTILVLKGNGKVKLQNPAGNELITVLSELLAFLINARTDTAIGPEPLYDITGADTLSAIKTKVDSFKV